MEWTNTWDDIIQGGFQRWKVTDPKAHKVALSHIQKHFKDGRNEILCPLAGDDPMVHLLWQQGHSVTAMDLVPAALEQMRNQFAGGWKEDKSRDNGMVVWTHESGRATQYQGDALQPQPELQNKFDAIYDKDSFGALEKGMRRQFCNRISEYTKSGATMYIEVTLRDNHELCKDMGPPFSLKKEDLMDTQCYGNAFNFVTGLGSVYPMALSGMQQTGHILRRK